mgnify:CR=1 FL=1
MNSRALWIAFSGLACKEVRRVFRIWVQTLLPSAITITLYFLIFGWVIGSRVGMMDGVSYMAYITPGLIMMPVITNAYANVVSSFFGARFNRSIEELLVSPMPSWLILMGYLSGGVVRGLVNGLIVSVIGAVLSGIHVQHPVLMLVTIAICSVLFSLLGFINGMFARKFDDLSIVTTFLLTPLIYLGGVFYSIHSLPPFWRMVSMVNPVHYIIEAFRYTMIGIGGDSYGWSMMVICLLTVGIFILSHEILRRGIRIKS